MTLSQNSNDAEDRLVSAEGGEETTFDVALRPRSLNEYVGQDALRSRLTKYLQAARQRQEPLDHTLFSGPPGLGKTTLACIIAHEMDVNIRTTSGPALERAGDLAAILTNLEPGDVLFIDEIHRMNRVVEETLYPAMEEFKIDVIFGQGPSARTVRLDLPRFTLVGATTRSGLLSSPLRDRFGINEHLEFYNVADLEKIIQRAAGLLKIDVEAAAGRELAARSRGTPRIANRLLRRVRDFAQVDGNGRVTLGMARGALEMLGVDSKGFDAMDRKILLTIMETYDGGPVGLETLAATIGEEGDTLEEVYEPFLLKEGFLHRTPKGRVVTVSAYEHLGRKPKQPAQAQML